MTKAKLMQLIQLLSELDYEFAGSLEDMTHTQIKNLLRAMLAEAKAKGRI